MDCGARIRPPSITSTDLFTQHRTLGGQGRGASKGQKVEAKEIPVYPEVVAGGAKSPLQPRLHVFLRPCACVAVSSTQLPRADRMRRSQVTLTLLLMIIQVHSEAPLITSVRLCCV